MLTQALGINHCVLKSQRTFPLAWCMQSSKESVEEL